MTILPRLPILLVLAAVALPAAAQRPATRPAPRPAARPAAPAPAPAPTATLAGAVTDSIYQGALVGATIVVDGTSRVGETDSLGRFRVDSVPVGSWRIALFHPMLDTLAVSIATQPIRFGPDSVIFAHLATPSLATLAEQWCAPAARRLGPGALLGRVIDAEASDVVADARVSLVFEEMVGVPGIAMRKMPRVRTGTSDASGRFALCGLPYDMTGTLQVERDGAKTPEISVTLDETGHAIHSVLFATPRPAVVAGADTAARGPARRLRGTATLRGRVAGPDRRPVAGARVSVEGTGAETTTDANGVFAISELPAGTWTVLARRVGARPEPQVVSLPPRRVTEVSLVLQAMTELDAVVVRDTVSQGLSRVGFERRRVGGMGHYLSPSEIEQRQPDRASDLLRTMPGLVVRPNARGGATVSASRDGGRGCVAVYVDGMVIMDGATDLDAQVPVNEIAAVEVYSGGTAPAEFTRPGQGACAVVVMWTKTRTRQGR